MSARKLGKLTILRYGSDGRPKVMAGCVDLEALVEPAARADWEAAGSHESWESLSEFDRNVYRDSARRTLALVEKEAACG